MYIVYVNAPMCPITPYGIYRDKEEALGIAAKSSGYLQARYAPDWNGLGKLPEMHQTVKV